MSILIATPTFENIAPECFRAIYNLKGNDLSFDFVKGYDCAKARNDIARKALNGGFEYVLMVDSDVIVPPDTISNMLDSPVDVCFGIYPRKSTTGETELFKEGTFDFKNRYTYAELDELESDKITVKGSGFGCALIKTEVFKNLEYPWFDFVSYENDTYLSEDLFFCMMAGVRYKLIADTRVRCGHIKQLTKYK